MENKCAVCDGTNGVCDMLGNGGVIVPLCDGCRELTVTLFHVYLDMKTAVKEARQAKLGDERCPKCGARRDGEYGNCVTVGCDG